MDRMCANVSDTSKTTSLLSDGSRARSLLSRLTQPLRSRTRNLIDFHIRALEPHRKYSPGDVVKGSVVLTVVKPIRITHLTVALHGFVCVYKHANGVGDHFDPSLIAPGSTNESQYFGNGHASLFQDEQTLCGEGRLDVGVYEFNFELEFPRKGLPSSIDFERGTISYMISSTITRPTSMATTTTCDRKVSLVETVDIGPMMPPKPRNITLEPITRKTKKKSSKKERTGSTTTIPIAEGGSGSDRIATPLPEESASQRDSNDSSADMPQSPASSHCPSEVSGGSAASNSTGLSFAQVSSKSGRDSKSSFAGKTITATIELMKAGCLPGDNIPLKISVRHTKVVKSLNGIIVTLYRQGRIDSAPPLSLFKDLEGKEAERVKHEEYYPKSKTGLGGLSLSSAGSSSVFRKDLSQTFAPLLIDPTTLSTEVRTSIRVPEDAFPTIKDVPGQMISFRYHVEVVVDLGGKLAGQDRFLPRLGMSSLPSSYSGGPQRIGRDDGNAAMLAALGGSIVDTDHIRRERSVVACLFEVVVGTTDSRRRRGRGSSNSHHMSDPVPSQSSYEERQDEPRYEEYYNEETYHQNNNQYHHSRQVQVYDYLPEGPYQQRHHNYVLQQATVEPVPPPEILDDEVLDEKTRLKRAEQRLLPSKPPGANDGTVLGPSNSSGRKVIDSGPSAPPDHCEDIHTANDLTPQLPISTQRPNGHNTVPSAPTLDELALPGSWAHPEEDKQELERMRLLDEASAPSDFPDDSDVGEGSSARSERGRYQPSAPVLTEEDEYGGIYSDHRGASGIGVRPRPESEILPRYER